MAVNFYTQNYCSNYASKFFNSGRLDFEKVKRYGAEFGLSVEDLKGNETQGELGHLLFNKQVKTKFAGINPIEHNKKSSIFSKKKLDGVIRSNSFSSSNQNQVDFMGRKLNIVV